MPGEAPLDPAIVVGDDYFTLSNEHYATNTTASLERFHTDTWQKFDKAGSLRSRANLHYEVNSTDGFAYDSLFYYYTADDRLAKTYSRAEEDRLDLCAAWMETDYTYDGFGRRVRKHVLFDAVRTECDEEKDKRTTHEYFYDGDHLLYERITESWGPGNPSRADSTDVVDVLYTRGPGGEAISRHVPQVILFREVSVGGSTDTVYLTSLFYHVNTQGTPVAGTDFTGERYVIPDIAQQNYVWNYSAGGKWATYISWYLSWTPAVGADAGVSFTGQPFDPEAGLHYFRNRYYDGQTGRFTQEDPIGLAGGLNLYAYANNNPVSYTDPFGLCPEKKRDEDGNCPGGLTVDEWNKVETAAKEHLKPLARKRILDALNEGGIRGADLGRDIANVSGWDPDVIRVNRSLEIFGRDLNQFEVDPKSLARFLAHEDRHVQQLANFGFLTRVLGGSEGFHNALQDDADSYARNYLIP